MVSESTKGLRLGRIVAAVLIASLILTLGGCSGSKGASPEGNLDPVLLDYVAPVEGDSWQAAIVHFNVGIARAKSPAVAKCLLSQGSPADESTLVEGAKFDAKLVGSLLPPLDFIAKNGVTRSEPSQLRSEREAINVVCPHIDSPRASKWTDAALELQQDFRLVVEEAVSNSEADPEWGRAQACMEDAGAPPPRTEMPDGTQITTGGADMYVVWVQSVEIDAQFSEHRPDGGSDASRAFARCLRPYFDVVERRLKEPRAEFVEEHREELVELQRQFASFDVAED